MELLPLGSIVTVREMGRELWMVVDRVVLGMDGKSYFDYLLIPYPTGYDEEQLMPIQHKEIETIHHIGYRNSQNEQYVQELEAVIEKEQLNQADVSVEESDLTLEEKSPLFELFQKL